MTGVQTCALPIYPNLLYALSILRNNKQKFRCALAGSGMTSQNDQLMDLINRTGLTDHVILLGPRSDVSTIMNGIDLHVLSSCAESLPVAVIEAMACGTPCVVTDVGDAGRLVGETGWVVPSRSPEALSVGIESAIAVLQRIGKEELGKACRDRIEQYYSLEKMADKYIKVWGKVLH